MRSDVCRKIRLPYWVMMQLRHGVGELPSAWRSIRLKKAGQLVILFAAARSDFMFLGWDWVAPRRFLLSFVIFCYLSLQGICEILWAHDMRSWHGIMAVRCSALITERFSASAVFRQFCQRRTNALKAPRRDRGGERTLRDSHWVAWYRFVWKYCGSKKWITCGSSSCSFIFPIKLQFCASANRNVGPG